MAISNSWKKLGDKKLDFIDNLRKTQLKETESKRVAAELWMLLWTHASSEPNISKKTLKIVNITIYVWQ